MRPCEIVAWLQFWNKSKTRPQVLSFVAVDDRMLTEEKGGAQLQGVLPRSHLQPFASSHSFASLRSYS